MSFVLYPWAWRQKLRSPAKIVLLYLVDAASRHDGKPDFICWPSLSKIADKTGLSKATISRCLDEIEAKKLIKRFRSKGGSTHSSKYKINCSSGDVLSDDHLSQSETVNCLRERQLSPQLSQSETPTVSQ